MPNAIQLAEATAAASARLRANGRTIEQSTEFSRIDREIAEMEKGRVSPEMSWLHNDLTSSNAFYIVIRNAEQELLAVCAVRHYQLNNEDLSSFLERQCARLYAGGDEAIDTSLMPPMCREITGSVCYMGDFFVAREGRVSKAFNNSDFIILVYGLAMMQFDPDWIFGFIKQKNAIRGLPAMYLVARCYPFALEWKVKPERRVDSDWIIGLNKRDLNYLFDLIDRGRLQSLNSVELVENKSKLLPHQRESEPVAKAADM